MSRNVIIPPVQAPGKDSASGSMELTLSLVGADGLPLPVADVANTLLLHGLGVHTISTQQLTLTLPTQDELPDTTYYRVQIRQGRDQYSKDVQLPAGGDCTWAQFLALSDPVTGGLAWAARLLPTGATDGQFATYDAATGLWEPISVAPGAGVEEAPIDGTPYARQDAGWVASSGGSTKLDDLEAPDDNTDLNVSTSAHGLAPKAVAPAAGALNAYGIAHGETAMANKTIFDGLLKVVVLTRAAYDALGPGRPATTLYICNG